jgi:hypothetical protein
MLHCAYNTQTLSSTERLASLARYVSDIADNTVNKQVNLDVLNNQYKETCNSNINNTDNNKAVIYTTKDDCATLDMENTFDTKNLNFLNPNDINLEKEPTDIQNTNVNNNLLFTVLSAGFNHGDFAEFSLGQRVFIPKLASKRGITILYLTSNYTTFHAWNFDFYKTQSKIATNSNFISLLRKLPGDTYFAMSIKDDAYKNLFEGTKNFLTKIIGCKSIWKLNYRNSWCAIIYKKTEKSFEVISEAYNPSGVAEVKYLILDPLTQNYSSKGNSSEKILPLSILKSSIVSNKNALSETEKNENINNVTSTQNESIVDVSKVSMVKIMEPSGKIISFSPQPYIVSPTEKTESSQNMLNDTINKISNEVQELKQLFLEQSNCLNLIKQLLESNKQLLESNKQ